MLKRNGPGQEVRGAESSASPTERLLWMVQNGGDLGASDHLSAPRAQPPSTVTAISRR